MTKFISMTLNLKNKFIDKRADLTEEEEKAYIRGENANLKLTVDQIDTAKANAQIKNEINKLKELAEKSDCVIVGRCASYILRDMEHMMSAFVYADQESRVNRAVSEYSVDPRRAEATLRKSDRRRETFYSINTGGNWYDKENYTLCLNSGALGIPLCADIIVSAAQKTIFV